MEGTTFLSVLSRLAEADPDRPALTCGEVTLTRAGFLDRVGRLAALFAARGVAEGSTVTIGLPNSIGLVESMFAAWALGAVPQPISDRIPPAERSAIVDLADPTLAVGMAPSDAGGRPVLESVPGQLPAGSFTPGVSPVWKLVTSGGSTGRPKLIAATAPAFFENVGGLGGLIRMRPDGCVLVTGPISHDQDLMAHLRQRLAPHKLPRVIEPATTPLRDDAGKVRRSALRAERIARRGPARRLRPGERSGEAVSPPGCRRRG